MLKRSPLFFVICTAGVMLAVAIYSTPVFAQQSVDSTGRTLDGVEQTLERKKLESEALRKKAAKLKNEVRSLNVNLVAAAKRVHEQETKVFELETELSRLGRDAGTKETQLRQRGNQFSGVVMALSRMSRMPTEALIVQPMAPEDMVRSAILLRATVPQLEHRAQSLRDELDGLSFARARIEERKAVLIKASKSLQDDQKTLETMIKRKTAMRAEAISKNRAANSAMRKLSKKAKTLRELLSRIEDSSVEIAARTDGSEVREKTSTANTVNPVVKSIESAPGLSESNSKTDGPNGFIGSISKARGQLPFPAIGRVVGLYGQNLGNGISRKGISIETRPRAQVIAPFDGKVVFSGPFRGYGQLLIIDHGEGYHSLLAGMDRIDAVLGNPVLAGEPVGVMIDAGEQPVLYVEFRRDNVPVNPLPWLVERKGSKQG